MIEIKVETFNLKNTLECGQCFRWERQEDNSYIGVIKDRVLKVRQEDNMLYVLSDNEKNLENVVKDYFDLNKDYTKLEKEISLLDDIISEAVKNTTGLHILNQDLFEMLISYIISANNNIKRISNSIKDISNRCGKKICFEGKNYYLFPTPEELSSLSIKDLENSKVGFRARYIYDTTGKVVKNINELEKLKEMSTDDAREKLMEYMGVGRKVADCILLFSLGREETFPVDVWIKRLMENLYIHSESSVKEILDYASNKFGKNAGIIQEHLFMNGRERLM